LLLDGNFTDKEVETACNRFAGAILIPQSKMNSELGCSRTTIYLQELAEIQKEWGISIQAIMYRAKDLEIISQNKMIQFFISIKQKPDLKKQVDESRYVSAETSYRFNQLLYKGLAQELISFSKASALSNKSVNELKNNLSFI
jgi:Zn-dependent peptidase ImmA (M78 family)